MKEPEHTTANAGTNACRPPAKSCGASVTTLLQIRVPTRRPSFELIEVCANFGAMNCLVPWDSCHGVVGGCTK